MITILFEAFSKFFSYIHFSIIPGSELKIMSNTAYILSVHSPFSDRVGLPLYNTPFPGVLMKSIGAAFFDRMPFLTSTTYMGCNMCYAFNVNVTDSFDDRRSQCCLI